MRWLLTAFLALTFTACANSPDEKSVKMDGLLPSEAALLIVRLEDGQRWSSGGARLSKRFSPASTSKIPHTLIALETGAVSGAGEMFEWDGRTRFSEGWNSNQNFATAFKRSTVWIYQILTPRIGHEALKDWLAKFKYGNADIGAPDDITQYWLSGPLAISAEEQVAFLSRLAHNDLPLSADTYEVAIQIMLVKASSDTQLYAKTGWKLGDGGPDIGWYVGWARQSAGPAKGTYVFAFNLDMNMPEIDRNRRKTIVHAALEDIGVSVPE